MPKVIEIQDLQKNYPLPRPAKAGSREFQAVKGITFSVEKGEIFGILGPNGAGKTTTLEIIECLKEQSGGQVAVLGLNNKENPDQIKQRIGVQLQSADYLPHLTLGELLDLFASLYGQTAHRQHLLELVDLVEKEHEQVKHLSGGQKQRFTIASSLVNKPEILFLDEPTTGLDPAARRNLWELIKKINAQGITIVLTTHYMEEAEYLCHRVAIMDRGKILEIDEPKKLIENLSHTTQISFLVSKPIDHELFRSAPGVTEIFSEFPKLTLEVSSLDHIDATIKLLKQHQIDFSSFTVKTATLEDVYLHLTGHSFENAHD